MQRHIIYTLCLSLVLLPAMVGCASTGPEVHDFSQPSDQPAEEMTRGEYVTYLRAKPPATLTAKEIQYLEKVEQKKQSEALTVLATLATISAAASVAVVVMVLFADEPEVQQ